MFIIEIEREIKSYEKVGRKWVIDDVSYDTITPQQYRNMVNSSGFFRRLGGTERQKRDGTYPGFEVTQITAISPRKNEKIVWNFTFTQKYKDNVTGEVYTMEDLNALNRM